MSLIVVWLFLAVPWVCLQFVIVVFPDHTHLLFLLSNEIDQDVCLVSFLRVEFFILIQRWYDISLIRFDKMA